MTRLGRYAAVTVAILALGYSNALVEWGSHHPGWLLGVGFFLVCLFLAVGGHLIDALIEVRSVRGGGVGSAHLPRVEPRPSSDGSDHDPVQARRHGMSPRARVTGPPSR